MTASTCENRNKIITNRLEDWKVSSIARMENTRTETIANRLENEKTANIGAIKEDLELCDVFMFMGDDVGISYHQTRFMTGKDIRDMGDNRVHNVYMNSYYVPSKRKIVKPVMKWKAPTN